jgi:hypothetical protein
MNTNILGLPVTRLLTSVLAPPLLLGTSLRTACNHIALPAGPRPARDSSARTG